MNKAVIQIPIDKDIRDKATLIATQEGFSSLQEPLRIFLTKYSQKKINFTFQEPEPIQLSKKAIKRYDKMFEDFKNNKNVVHADSVEDFLDKLNL